MFETLNPFFMKLNEIGANLMFMNDIDNHHRTRKVQNPLEIENIQRLL